MSTLLKKLALASIAFVVTFALIEGLASEVLLAYRLLAKSPRALAERSHTRYDPELGWVALPNVSIPDLYGPGISLRTNAMGFRNDRDFDRDPPSGKLRVLCSGDSFTLGYGVDNEHAWCPLLAKLDPRLETVNMGQGGYGIDQSYLWYQRDGVKLRHQVLVFAFVTADFNRMQWDRFLGYDKPLLKVRDGKLVVENVPVPERSLRFSWFVRNRPLFAELAAVKLVGAVLERIAPGREARKGSPPSDEARAVAAAIFAALRDLTRAQDATLVLTYLPTEGDYDGEPLTDDWRRIVAEESERRQIAFVDLIPDFRQMPRNLRAMFIPAKTLQFGDAAGHYTAKGNEIVASLLYEKLAARPEIAARLAAVAKERTSAR